MKIKIKNTLITIATSLLVLLIVTTATYAIGTLTPSGTAGDDTQYSLNDIYTKLTTGATTTEDTGTMTVPGSVSASFRTLTEIYEAIPEWLTLSNSTTTVEAGYYEATSLATVDTDLDAANIVTGTTIFGVEGSAPAGAAELEWSTEQGSMTWNSAVSTCAGTVDGSTGWRLPTISELLAGISDDWIIENDGEGDRFVSFRIYWSGTEYDESHAWHAFWVDSMGYNSDSKTSEVSVRCVH